jgi:hypothetical protein
MQIDDYFYAVNALLGVTLLLLTLLLTLAKRKQQPSLVQKILYKVFSFLAHIFHSAIALPFLTINISYASCENFASRDLDCFEGANLIKFAVSILSLVTFMLLTTFNTKCLNLNVDLPID